MYVGRFQDACITCIPLPVKQHTVLINCVTFAKMVISKLISKYTKGSSLAVINIVVYIT